MVLRASSSACAAVERRARVVDEPVLVGGRQLDERVDASNAERHAENIRRMLLAMTSDIRVILIKLADRMHNLMTLRFQPPHKQQRIAKETLDKAFAIDDFRADVLNYLKLLDQLDGLMGADDDPTIYLGSTAIDYCLPGFASENQIDLGDVQATVRLWLGTRHRVAAHYDVLENIAVVGAGRRRFILLPPEQLPNLYVGPIDFTPAGQPVSMVDFEHPDPSRYPRFQAALDHARGTVLEPGLASYVPRLLWRAVDGVERKIIVVTEW